MCSGQNTLIGTSYVARQGSHSATLLWFDCSHPSDRSGADYPQAGHQQGKGNTEDDSERISNNIQRVHSGKNQNVAEFLYLFVFLFVFGWLSSFYLLYLYIYIGIGGPLSLQGLGQHRS